MQNDSFVRVPQVWGLTDRNICNWIYLTGACYEHDNLFSSNVCIKSKHNAPNLCSCWLGWLHTGNALDSLLISQVKVFSSQLGIKLKCFQVSSESTYSVFKSVWNQLTVFSSQLRIHLKVFSSFKLIFILGKMAISTL